MSPQQAYATLNTGTQDSMLILFNLHPLCHQAGHNLPGSAEAGVWLIAIHDLHTGERSYTIWHSGHGLQLTRLN